MQYSILGQNFWLVLADNTMTIGNGHAYIYRQEPEIELSACRSALPDLFGYKKTWQVTLQMHWPCAVATFQGT